MSGTQKKASAYGEPAGDTDFRKNWDLEEYAARAKEKESKEREEARQRHEARAAGKKWHAPRGPEPTAQAAAREATLDVSSLVGRVQLVAAGAAVGRRGRGAGFYCAACDLTFKDNRQWVEHANSTQHLRAVGQNMEVAVATAADVRARIEQAWLRIEAGRREREASLRERLAARAEEERLEDEERRARRRAEAARRREERERDAAKRAEYGDDVRVEGEHDEDDLVAAVGFAAFGSSKKR